MADDRKSVRLHILMDEPFRKMIAQASHDSWMSAGQYVRETVSLFKGAKYDDAADMVMIGREIGLDGFELLREYALRAGVTIKQCCESLGRGRAAKETPPKEVDETPDEEIQVSLFDTE